MLINIPTAIIELNMDEIPLLKNGNGRPVFGISGCIGCMACIHACPQKAIGYAVLQEKNPNARYRHPEISLAEIIQSNNQD